MIVSDFKPVKVILYPYIKKSLKINPESDCEICHKDSPLFKDKKTKSPIKGILFFIFG